MATTTFPITVDEVSPQWLGDVLGVTVRGVRPEPLGVGVGILGALYRVHLDSDGGPASVVVKMSSPHAENRAFASTYGLYRKEVCFYLDASTKVPLRTPQCWFAAIDDAGEWSCIVMADHGDGVSPDQITGLRLDEAEAVIDALAGLHATYWDDPALDALTWLPRLDAPQFLAAQDNAQALFPLFEERYGPVVGDRHVRLVHDLLPHVAGLLRDWAGRGPETLTHSDVRGDNLLFVGEPTIDNLVVLDWQLAVRSRSAYDVAYFLVGSLSVEDRRRHEAALVERYVDALARRGVRNYDASRCRSEMREWMLVLVSTMPSIAAADPGNERGRVLLSEMLGRWAVAAADYDVAALMPGR